MADPAIGQIFNFLPISERLATAGQPTREQFAAIGSDGYGLVINLAPSDSSNAIANEEQLVAENGMRYVHIPVDWKAPRLEDLTRFFEVMEQNREQKVFVHCAMNLRVSSFVYLYRVLRLNEPEPEAALPLNEIWGRVAVYAKGSAPESTAVAVANSFYQPDGIWRRFIDQALAAKFWC
ncbi:MAG: protein tyrosine phosphatase family protein [Nevskiales bacterium]